MIENNKFNKVLTVLLIIIVVALIVAAGFWGFDIFQKSSSMNLYTKKPRICCFEAF